MRCKRASDTGFSYRPRCLRLEAVDIGLRRPGVFIIRWLRVRSAITVWVPMITLVRNGGAGSASLNSIKPYIYQVISNLTFILLKPFSVTRPSKGVVFFIFVSFLFSFFFFIYAGHFISKI